MSTVRRFKCLAAMVVVTVMVMAAGAAAQTWDCGETPGTVTCTLNDGTFTVSGSGAMTNTSPWYGSSSSITSVIIENGVTSIGDYAFRDCIGLTSVTISNSVTSIGREAFSSCTSLTSVTIPNSVTYIGDRAFVNSGLTSVTIGNSVTSIGDEAFGWCHGMTSVTIGNSVASIGEMAFAYNDGITSITIPSSVTSIGDGAFQGCAGLTSITIPNSVTYLSGFSGTGLTSITIPSSVTSIGNGAFAYTGLTSITIPSNVTSIGDEAFQSCAGLTSITIPSNVTSIGDKAFAYCTNLTSVICLREIPPTIGSKTFVAECAWDGEDCKTTMLWSYLFVPEATIGTYNSADGWKDFHFIRDTSKVTEYVQMWGWYTDGVPTTIWAMLSKDGTLTVSGAGNMDDKGNPYYYWRGASGLHDFKNSITSIVIGDGVTSIGNHAFSSYTNPTSVTIPNSVTSIGDGSFGGCTGLTSVTIPNSVISIGERAFSSCTNLTSVTIGNSVTSIGDETFSYTGLTSVTIPNSVTSIGERAFIMNSGLTSVTIGNNVTAIGDETFMGCTSLTSVTIPNSVTSIGDGAFASTGLTSVTIPNSVTSIGNRAFGYCRGLTSVTIGNSVTSIGDEAFSGTVLTTVTIPNSVTSIGDKAFASTGLTSIEVSPDNVNWTSDSGILFNKDETILLQYPASKQGTSYIIPNSVTSIGAVAFFNCYKLKSVTIPNSVTSIGDGAFGYCSGLTSVISLGIVPPIVDANEFLNNTSICRGNDGCRDGNGWKDTVMSLNGCLFVPEAAIDAYRSADGWKNISCIKSLDEYVSVASAARVIPPTGNVETVVVVPVAPRTGEFTAGPNPVGKSSGGIAFFWNGKQIKSGTLTVYDATGNVVRKLAVNDNAGTGNARRRAVVLWDLKDSKGRQVSKGTYLVKGKIAASGSKAERVSVVVGVR